jgi:hypothetical protein
MEKYNNLKIKKKLIFWIIIISFFVNVETDPRLG